jgi:hypothetical protein
LRNKPGVKKRENVKKEPSFLQKRLAVASQEQKNLFSPQKKVAVRNRVNDFFEKLRKESTPLGEINRGNQKVGKSELNTFSLNYPTKLLGEINKGVKIRVNSFP